MVHGWSVQMYSYSPGFVTVTVAEAPGLIDPVFQDPSRASTACGIVEVFVMPYGSLNSEGEAILPSGEVQVQDFAAFYVMGFPGDKCNSDPSTQGTEIVGHFIKYISTDTEGSGGQKCSTNSLGQCIIVLTR